MYVGEVCWIYGILGVKYTVLGILLNLELTLTSIFHELASLALPYILQVTQFHLCYWIGMLAKFPTWNINLSSKFIKGKVYDDRWKFTILKLKVYEHGFYDYEGNVQVRVGKIQVWVISKLGFGSVSN